MNDMILRGYFLGLLEKYRFLVHLALVLSIILILIFGLNPRSVNWDNTALINDSHLILSKGSYAFSYIKSNLKKKNSFHKNGFSMEVILKPQFLSLNSTTIFRLLFPEADESNLYVFQWKDKLIISLGRDYNYKKQLPRVTAQLKDQWQKVKFEYLDGSMRVYVDDDLVDLLDSELIKPPSNIEFLLKVGDFSSLPRGWHGSISYLSIFPSEGLDITAIPIFQFGFNEELGKQDALIASSENILVIPKYPVFFDRELLGFSAEYFAPRFSSVFDIIINITGFIPFGFLLVLFLSLKNNVGFSSFLITLVFGFFLSFLIEYAQSWLPLRNSSGFDLILNTIGSIIGAFLLFFFRATDKNRL